MTARDAGNDSIVALASGPVPAGVAVLRLSGPAAGPVLARLTGRALPPPQRLSLRTIRDPATGEALDRALVAWFPGPGSFTGEDTAELHLHGGPAVVSGALDAVARAGLEAGLPCRLANPGEFTRRAFENDRLDLAAVEGLSDLVRAETAAQRRQALRAAGGRARRTFERWRADLETALAYAEAGIDFADEDLPEDLVEATAAAIRRVRGEIESEVARGMAGMRLREGFLVAIVGPPNAGKSSLLNALAGREAAIVSGIPGTTRDIVEVSMDLNGIPVTMADTAGLREAADAVEAEGVRRARGLAERADLTLLVLEATDWPEIPAAMRDAAAGADMVVWTKTDLAGSVSLPRASHDAQFVSSVTRDGLDTLADALLNAAQDRLAGGEDAIVTRQRHQDALTAMAGILAEWSPDLEPEIQAHLIHQANREMAGMLGRADIENVLDRIFREFCIGK